MQDRARSPRNSGRSDGENAGGTDASFVCGSFVRFSIEIDQETRIVADAKFQTNGCGYMIAAADALTEIIKNKHLGDLHGLQTEELRNAVFEMLGVFDDSRRQCADCSIRALRTAFADFRTRQIEEFHGEKALICTCFGVAENTIESLIEERSVQSVEEVGRLCNAGTGCGSCRMLIQEMLDAAAGE
ncbi:MAG: iron-sulfur cluster assembly scaffold protein [Acidobacteriota bacterium]